MRAGWRLGSGGGGHRRRLDPRGLDPRQLDPPRLDPRRLDFRRLGWRLLVSVTAAVGGLVLATSAVTARGTQLRAGPTRLSDLLTAQERTLAAQTAQERSLRVQVAERTRQVAAEERPVATARSLADSLAGPAGLTAVRGPAVTVRLDDAPRGGVGIPTPSTGGAVPTARPDDLVVHQQDVQGVVNALWSGGAEAMTIMGKRVISTTAVRCVGNTLLLQNAVYSPPFVISALGDPARLVAALDADPDVSIFRQYVAVYRLGYAVKRAAAASFPAYDGPLDLRASG